MWVFKFNLWGRIGQLHCPLMAIREMEFLLFLAHHGPFTFSLSLKIFIYVQIKMTTILMSQYQDGGWCFAKSWPMMVLTLKVFQKTYNTQLVNNRWNGSTIFYWKLLRISCIMDTMKPCMENVELIPVIFFPITHKLKISLIL